LYSNPPQAAIWFSGELMGIPPTGKQVKVSGITIDRLEGGKIVEEWGSFDQLGMLQQIGVIPS
jgi:predicted ester cyclase